MFDEQHAQQMNLCAFRVQQTICLRGFKRPRRLRRCK